MNSGENIPSGEESALDSLFRSYRAACPDVEPGVNFMPVLWQKIEARRGFWTTLGRFGKSAVTASAALCVVLLVLNFTSTPQLLASYTDALLADSSAEQTYYTEAIRPGPLSDTASPAGQR
jgi:hypothetical protein